MFGENNRCCIFAKGFAKISAIFVNFRYEIFTKTKINFCKNYRENVKTKIFVSTLIENIWTNFSARGIFSNPSCFLKYCMCFCHMLILLRFFNILTIDGVYFTRA
jgi:hypothetical protein